jgi:hypothetical protein
VPKRWSIVLTIQRRDETTGKWVDEGRGIKRVSRQYPDDKVQEVKDKRDRIKKKADQEK